MKKIELVLQQIEEEGAVTVKQVAEKCGLELEAARKVLSVLWNRGSVVPVGALPPNAVFFKFPETKGFGLHIRSRTMNRDADGEIKSDAEIFKLMEASTKDSWTVAEVAEATGFHKNTARRSLLRLEEDGRMFRVTFPNTKRGRPPDQWSTVEWGDMVISRDNSGGHKPEDGLSDDEVVQL
jgi:predicted ArsR family transcriptional regulator